VLGIIRPAMPSMQAGKWMVTNARRANTNSPLLLAGRGKVVHEAEVGLQ
jgi:hypothetical protein